jgi:hypothetical protein
MNYYLKLKTFTNEIDATGESVVFVSIEEIPFLI